ncbi:MAG TPA: tetratricopeptide repeat protein [Pyrinomonadaceae bacterium]|jgi:tetratricopeptide (TPR) repeat protein|nr:tetratricopeptide repeat protein [Pyrinomonadaceae bacterium]
MLDWLNPLLMMFYAPARGMALVRERAPLGAAALLALAAQVFYELFAQWQFLPAGVAAGGALVAFSLVRTAVGTLLVVACIFIPALIFFSNLFERRASFGVVLQQEYASVASAVLYAWAAAHAVALPLALLARANGFEAEVIASTRELIQQFAAQSGAPPRDVAPALDPRELARNFASTLALPFVALWTLAAARHVFRASWLRASLIVAGGVVMVVLASPLLRFAGSLLSSPFLLLMLFFLLRGYFGEVMRTQRARASFRQHLEASTLNPADASAHYNLGLIHLSRKELDPARERFRRAVEIDADEVDSHYQLGRIARMQGRLSDAIAHFSEVVTRDPAHAQHEIWREIGATYLAASQHGDALDALDKFLARRQSDAEGLYLKGRALAGVGRVREAAEAMRACIEAVKSAPAYKYRTDKRWLNEAQQFLRSQA